MFLIVIMMFFAGFAWVEFSTLRRWRGFWRWAAALPGIALLFIALSILIGTLLDPTSHNLWPFEILIWSAGGLIFLALLHLIHKLTAGEKKTLQ